MRGKTGNERDGAPRAAIYVRVSTAQQEDGFSLDTQEQRCRAFAVEHGYEVTEVYREVFTGVELWERPQLTALREAMRHHAFTAVVAFAIDRLARDPVHLGVIISEADHAGVDVHFVTEPLDSTPEGQLIRFVRGYAAKVEHEKLRERSMRGRRARAESGKPMASGRPLYGYRWRDAAKSALLPDPLTAPVVQRIFAAVAAGGVMDQIARDLTSECIPTPMGRRAWNTSTIHHLVHHPYYRGEAIAYRHHWVKQGGRRIHQYAAQPIPLPAGTVPALIDPELWPQVMAMLDANLRQAARRNRQPEAFLLRAGYVVCDACGNAMRCNTRLPHRGLPRYICARKYDSTPTCTATVSIGAPELDTAVWAKVIELLAEPEIVRQEVARLRRHDPTPDDLAAIDLRIEHVERTRANALRNANAMTDPEDAGLFLAEVSRLGEERRKLLVQRDTIAARQQQWQEAQTRLDDLETWLCTVRANLDELDYTKKRLALTALGVQVRVFPRVGEQPATWELRIHVPLSAASVESIPTKRSGASSSFAAWRTGGAPN